MLDNSLADGRENDEIKEVTINTSEKTKNKKCFKHGKGSQKKAQQKHLQRPADETPAGP